MSGGALKFYSNPAHRQDRWVVQTVLGARRGGFFVDAGAGPDGVAGSNTYALESQLDWRGICIEPHPERFSQVKRNRRAILENVCLTDRPGEVVFTLNHERPGTSGIVSEQDEASRDDDYRPGVEYQEIRVPGVPLWELLRRHAAPSVIDYMSVDIEGAEWLALKDFPFHEYTFSCLTIERNAARYPDLRRLLERHGYRVTENYCGDDFYVHESLGYRAPASTRARTALRTQWRSLYGREPLRSARRVARRVRARLLRRG